MKNEIVEAIENIQNDIVNIRRKLHKNPECGFDLKVTNEVVTDFLKSCGYVVDCCGKSGICALAGKEDSDFTILLRCDMDGLPMEEKTEITFKSTNGNMHSCCHDFHTSIMLGVAKIIKQFENRLTGRVKFMFQPAEEILEGANNMIKNGILEKPRVNCAISYHLLPTEQIKSTIIVPKAGEISPYSNYFKIILQGKATHGAMPQNGIDPILTASKIIISLQEINSRELCPFNNAAITVGEIKGGNSANAIPEIVEIRGSFRAFDEEKQEYIKKRLYEITNNISKAFRTGCKIEFTNGCPSMIVDHKMNSLILDSLSDVFGSSFVTNSADEFGVGSEDFSFITHKVPSAFFSICAKSNGYPLHHPKLVVEDEVLKDGILAVVISVFKIFENQDFFEIK